MPIYGFECKTCGTGFETLVRASEEPACPSCGSVDLDRQLSLIAPPAKRGGSPAPPCESGEETCGYCCRGQACG